MSKNVYPKTLLAFFILITPASLASCNQASKDNYNYTYNINKQENNVNTIAQDVDDLGQLLDSFIREIGTLQDEEKESFKLLKIKESNQKIQSISINIEAIYSAKSASSSENNDKLLNDIKRTLTNIKNIIQPLLDGLTDESVGKVQENLGIFTEADRNKSNYGKFNDETKAGISRELTENNKKLAQYIKALVTSNNISSGENIRLKTIEQQVKELESTNNKLNYIAWISFVLSSVSLLLLSILVIDRGGCRTIISSIISKQKENAETSENLSEDTSDTPITALSNDENQTNKTNNNTSKEYSSNSDELKDRTHTSEEDSRTNILQNQYNTNTSSQEKVCSSPESKQQNLSSLVSEDSEISTTQSLNLQTHTPNFLAAYNNKPNSLDGQFIEVNYNVKSIENHRLGGVQKPIFETSNRGKGSFWIIKEDQFDYLVPKANLTFNPHRYDTAQALFQCRGYENSQQNFTVKEAARVVTISGNKWQLDKMGILEFY